MQATGSDRAWALRFAGVVMALTTVPYLVGFAAARADPAWTYSGLLFASEDGFSYLAKMMLGASGAWLFRSPYTAYPTGGMLAFLPYLLLGKLAAPPAQWEQIVALFHLFRVAAGVLLVLAIHDFLALFLADVRLRRMALVLAVLGGGFGWLAVVGLGGLWAGALPGMEIPLEFYSPETFGFLMILGLPHLAAARALLLWTLTAYLKAGGAAAGRWDGLRPGLLCLGIGFMQPLTVVVTWAVLAAHLSGVGAWLAWRSRKGAAHAFSAQWPAYARRAAVIVLVSLPAAAYTFLALRADPVLAAWEGRNRIVSPPPFHYLLAFGLLLPLALAGIRAALRRDAFQGWLLAAWVAAFPLLAYAPYTLQRRLPEGVWVALVALAFGWLETRGMKARRWAPVVAGASLLTTLILWAGSLAGVSSPAPPLYRPAGEARAFRFLAERARRDDVVLAAYDTSTALPAWSAVRVLTGSGPESIDLEALQERTGCFYRSGCAEGERAALLRQFAVDYVLWGPAERALGDWDPREWGALRPIYQRDGWMIFEVTRLSPQK